MYVRLAFAVAAHLEPEILIVDEVLAVGDAEFQKKCLGKMRDVATTNGRTVIFVSHNLAALRNVCGSGIHLRDGRVKHVGAIQEVLAEYAEAIEVGSIANLPGRSGVTKVQVDAAQLAEGSLRLEIWFSVPEVLFSPTFGIVVYDQREQPVFGTNTLVDRFVTNGQRASKGRAVVEIPNLPLWSGVYTISVWLSDGLQAVDHVRRVVGFEFPAIDEGTHLPSRSVIGATRVKGIWSLWNDKNVEATL
jgi:lipopolysaccharide transport system ATP-binding protein